MTYKQPGFGQTNASAQSHQKQCFLLKVFINSYCKWKETAKLLARLHECAGSPEVLLFAYVRRPIFSWHGSYINFIPFDPVTSCWLHKAFCMWKTLQNWGTSWENRLYDICKQQNFRRACTSAQSYQKLYCLPLQTVGLDKTLSKQQSFW